MRFRMIALAGAIFFPTSVARAAIVGPRPAFECDPTPEGLIAAKNSLFDLASREKNPEAIERAVRAPLRCLTETARRGGGLAKYLAMRSLKPFLGQAESPELPKKTAAKRVVKLLIEKELGAGESLEGTFVARVAAAEWDFYIPFCARDELCFELVPESETILADSDLAGAASLLVLAHAFRRFDGESRRRVERRLRELDRMIPKTDPVKRKIMNEIRREILDAPRSKKSSLAGIAPFRGRTDDALT